MEDKVAEDEKIGEEDKQEYYVEAILVAIYSSRGILLGAYGRVEPLRLRCIKGRHGVILRDVSGYMLSRSTEEEIHTQNMTNGAPKADIRSVHPPITASASAGEGSAGLSAGEVKKYCVSSRALLALPSEIPAFKLIEPSASEAIFGQSASGCMPIDKVEFQTLFMYAKSSVGSSHLACKWPPPLPLIWPDWPVPRAVYCVEQFGVRDTLS